MRHTPEKAEAVNRLSKVTLVRELRKERAGGDSLRFLEISNRTVRESLVRSRADVRRE